MLRIGQGTSQSLRAAATRTSYTGRHNLRTSSSRLFTTSYSSNVSSSRLLATSSNPQHQLLLQNLSRISHRRHEFRISRAFSSPSNKPPQPPQQQDPAATNAGTANATVVAQQQFQRLQRAVTDLNLGDQVSVLLISILTILILASPYILKQLKSLNQDDYDEFWANDTIDDLAKLARTEWGKEEEVVLEDGESKTFKNNALETILQDVMQSQTLQQAAQQFVVTVISSEPVKTALNRLLAELFRDLIQDKETVAQVIQLLNKVIQDDTIKRAAQDLVLEIVDDPEVKESLVAMLQRVAREEPVPATITDLLKQSAHATLNDEDILDHRYAQKNVVSFDLARLAFVTSQLSMLQYGVCNRCAGRRHCTANGWGSLAE